MRDDVVELLFVVNDRNTCAWPVMKRGAVTSVPMAFRCILAAAAVGGGRSEELPMYYDERTLVSSLRGEFARLAQATA